MFQGWRRRLQISVGGFNSHSSCHFKTMKQFKYIVSGDDSIAMPLLSSMPYLDIVEYIRQVSDKKDKTPVFTWGSLKIFNPVVQTVDDYVNCLPGIIEGKLKWCRCTECRGEGKIMKGRLVPYYVKCDYCKGTGKIKP